MFKNHSFYLAILNFAGAVFLFFSMSSVADAKPFRLTRIPEAGQAFGCMVCHQRPSGGHQLNPFGEDYKRIGIPNGDTYTKELGEMDSDGDGFTNNQEFESNTHPGDPDSKPQS